MFLFEFTNDVWYTERNNGFILLTVPLRIREKNKQAVIILYNTVLSSFRDNLCNN